MQRAGGPMEVAQFNGIGEPAEDGSRYLLRWEHAGVNRDAPVPEPWPAPTMLRVYRITATE